MYERVLIPLDGSELAEAILPFAEWVAGPLDAEVVLLSVVEPISVVAGLAAGGVVGPDALLLRQLEAKKYLGEVAHRRECGCGPSSASGCPPARSRRWRRPRRPT